MRGQGQDRNYIPMRGQGQDRNYIREDKGWTEIIYERTRIGKELYMRGQGQDRTGIIY